MPIYLRYGTDAENAETERIQNYIYSHLRDDATELIKYIQKLYEDNTALGRLVSEIASLSKYQEDEIRPTLRHRLQDIQTSIKETTGQDATNVALNFLAYVSCLQELTERLTAERDERAEHQAELMEELRQRKLADKSLREQVKLLKQVIEINLDALKIGAKNDKTRELVSVLSSIHLDAESALRNYYTYPTLYKTELADTVKNIGIRARDAAAQHGKPGLIMELEIMPGKSRTGGGGDFFYVHPAFRAEEPTIPEKLIGCDHPTCANAVPLRESFPYSVSNHPFKTWRFCSEGHRKAFIDTPCPECGKQGEMHNRECSQSHESVCPDCGAAHYMHFNDCPRQGFCAGCNSVREGHHFGGCPTFELHNSIPKEPICEICETPGGHAQFCPAIRQLQTCENCNQQFNPVFSFAFPSGKRYCLICEDLFCAKCEERLAPLTSHICGYKQSAPRPFPATWFPAYSSTLYFVPCPGCGRIGGGHFGGCPKLKK